jgi:hypothetical protein
MANYVTDKGYLATGATAYLFGELVVVSGAAGTSCARATSAGASILGVCQEDLDTARLATGKAVIGVRLLGIARVLAGVNNITYGAALTNDVTARAVIQAGAVGSGAPTFGRALQPSANVGDQIDVLLTPFGTM